MSAAEKLKELAEKPVLNMFKIGDALPQIVAVVEAAQAHEPYLDDLQLTAALAALDEALA